MMLAAELLHAQCLKCKKTIAFAESCTGGQMAAAVTALDGASNYFLGSFVVYSNQMKEKILGVSAATLATKGAVSEETVREMVRGIFQRVETDFALAVTGIAGPTGGSQETPVGTVWAAIGKRGQEPLVHNYLFAGDRSQIIAAATETLLRALAKEIN